MDDHHISKRLASTLIMTAFLAALFLLIATFEPGFRTQTASAHQSADMAPAHETEATETHHPEETETHHPEATETEHEGEPSRTARPTETHEGEPTETEHPEATETHHPDGTQTAHPEATETHEGEPSRTARPTETEHEGEPSRTARPTETHEGEPSRTPHETETHHPEATETEHPEATETHHPEGTRTALATETGIPTPIPTGVAPVIKKPISPPVTIPGAGSRSFPETGKSVQGMFLQYWDNSGGLLQQGYPISAPMQEQSAMDGKTYAVQYFERAVFELHPENKAPFNILLSQLGTFRYNARYPNGAPGQVANKTSGAFFPQTGHWVGGTFLRYWNEHGGLAQQGYPISEEFTEISPLNGKPYTVQYFERAVFELHPENKAPFNVLLSQLGTFQYKEQYNDK